MALSVAEFSGMIAAGDPPGLLRNTTLFREDLRVDVDACDGEGRCPIVFVPDLHLLSMEVGAGYGDFFHLNASRKGVLLAFLSRLLELRNKTPEFSRVRVYQLGDLHDLWRESQHWWGEGIKAKVARQLESHRDLFGLLKALDSERLAGNHDNDLRSAKVRAELVDAPICEWLPLYDLHPDLHSFLWGARTRVDLLHADQVDTAEQPWYRRLINPVGSRFAEHGGLINIGAVDEWQHEVSPAAAPDQQLLQPTVRFDDANATDTREKFYKELLDKETCAEDASWDEREAVRIAVVIGHTHQPRIVVGTGNNGYTLMDCGSWVNQSQGSADPKDIFWNSQIGVLTGNECAVLQIGT